MAKRSAYIAPALPAPPPIPEPKLTAAELARKQADQAEIMRLLNSIRADQVEQNLDRALRLVQMAQRGQGPLIDYFTDLGFKYAKLADEGPVEDGALAETHPRRLVARQ